MQYCQGGLAAGMHVVAIPSLTDLESYPPNSISKTPGSIQKLSSLLEFNPLDYGLPSFTDYICGSIPVTPPLCIKGIVVKGFGRGSKVSFTQYCA